MELALLFPSPWRYAIGVLLIAALIHRFSLLGKAWALLLLVTRSLAQLMGFLAEKLQDLCAGKPSGKLIDYIDSVCESIIVKARNIINEANKHLPTVKNSLRLNSQLVLLLPVIALGIYYMRPALGDITVAKWVDQTMLSWHKFEGWALTGRVGIPISWEEFAQVETPYNGDIVHIVQKYENITDITERYRVNAQCIISENSKRYPEIYENKLKRGWAIIVLRNDSRCRYT